MAMTAIVICIIIFAILEKPSISKKQLLHPEERGQEAPVMKRS